MNNQQFRKLMLATSGKSPSSSRDADPSKASSHGSLGSRQRASMTPRLGGDAQAAFARQLADRNRATHPDKKFRSFVPKGSKVATGYTDRSRDRDPSPIDDREERLEALEESYKKEEIDKDTYEQLRYQIAGGDLESTHLVKGLDFKLLKRIREGEDVNRPQARLETARDEAGSQSSQHNDEDEDVDDQFDQLESQEVQAIAKDTAQKKKGELSTVSLAPGRKRTRDQILAELKAARKEAAAQQESALGGRFSKIGAKKAPGSRVERDHKGREVLIIVDEHGNEKRKVRKVQTGLGNGESSRKSDLLMPDKNAEVLGMEVPEHYQKLKEQPEDDGDVDIFDDVGDDYDPLAGMDGSDSESEKDPEDADDEAGHSQVKESRVTQEDEAAVAPPPPTSKPRNYFQDSRQDLASEEQYKAPSLSDPTIMSAIKKAAAMQATRKQNDSEDEDDDDLTPEERERRRQAAERRKRMLESSNRDDQDMDLGFGTSRYEDEEDFDDQKIKLSKWGTADDGKGGGGRGDGQPKRKRGPKKRKGDANNAADVLRVMEQRKKA